MYINIKPKEVIQAKRDMKVFDSIKTYDKFKCGNNYIGLLGEMVFHRYLMENNINHQWIEFMKGTTTEPDFIIRGKTIDIKTSTSKKMWLTKTSPHDIYISFRVMKQDTQLVVLGWLPRGSIEKAKSNGQAEQVTFGSRVAYAISDKDMLPITMLPGVFPSSPGSLHSHEVKQ